MCRARALARRATPVRLISRGDYLPGDKGSSYLRGQTPDFGHGFGVWGRTISLRSLHKRLEGNAAQNIAAYASGHVNAWERLVVLNRNCHVSRVRKYASNPDRGFVEVVYEKNLSWVARHDD